MPVGFLIVICIVFLRHCSVILRDNARHLFKQWSECTERPEVVHSLFVGGLLTVVLCSCDCTLPGLTDEVNDSGGARNGVTVQTCPMFERFK